jgi:hypothetical protein
VKSHFSSEKHTLADATFLKDIEMCFQLFWNISRILHVNLEYIDNIIS